MAEKLRVLYVDDEPGLLGIGKLFLEREGEFAVDILTSAMAALEQLNTKRYDAIISDYQMPEMDGITFLKQLKASGNTTPFIIFTGRGREEVVIEALNEGADFYIQKGGEPRSQFTELAHKIQSAVSRQRTEKLAKDTERRLHDIINFLPDATFAIDTEGEVIAWNRAIEEMTGVPARDMLGRGNYEYSIPFYGERRPILIDLVAIPDEELTRGKYAVIKKEGGILIAETTLPRPLGRYSVLLGKASLLYNEEGDSIGAIESIRDITEQKRAEKELRKAHDEYVDLLEHMDDVYYRSDTQGRLILASRSWAKDLGYDDLSECLGKNIADTFYAIPGERKKFLEEVYRNGSVSDYEVALKKKDGTILPVATSSYLWSDGSGTILGVEGTWRDITERKRADEALLESEGKYRTLVEKANEAIMIAQDEVFVFANRRMSDLLGVPVADLEGKAFINFIWPDDRELVIANYRKRLSGETISDAYDFRIIGAGGRLTWVFLSAAVIQWKGRPATLNLVTDITGRKRAEEALRASEEKLRLKLDSVLSPDVDLDEQDLANILDTVSIQSLMDDLHTATGMAIGIVDLKGNILVKAGWQDICTFFHRVHPETSKNCVESNLSLSSGVPKGEFRAYRCKNHMWDIVTPIFIGDKHIGNLFFGQFFYEDEVPDHQVFINQATKYGFDKEKYLAALNSVPRWSREKVQHIMQFYAKFADLVSKLSYSNVKLAKMISTQKLVEAALTDREEQSRMLLSQLPDIVMVHQGGIVVYANQTAVDRTGFSREELIGSNLFDYVLPEYREIIARNMERRASGERVGDYEIEMVHKSGALHHVIARTSPIMFNQVPSVVMILIDITERKRAEVALSESEEKYRLIFENSPLGHLSFDQNGVIVACNDKFIQIIGSSREALIGLNMLSLPDTNIVSAVQKALAGSHGLYEGVYTSVTGKKITPVRGLFAPMNTGGGRVPGGVGIFEDITERKQAVEALRHQSETLSILNDIITAANKADDLSELLQRILEESLRLLDFDAGGIYLVDLSTRTADIVHSINLPPEFLAEIRNVPIDKKPFDRLFIQNEQFITDNYAHINPDMSKKYGFQSIASVPLLSKGVAIGALNIASLKRQVISEEEKQTLISIGRELGSTIERMASEEELKQVSNNLETLFKSIDEMVFVLDMQGRILSVNDAVQKHLSYAPEELIGTNVLLLHVPERRDEALRIVQGMIAGTNDSCPVPVLSKSGTPVEVETTITRGWWNSQEVLFGVSRNVTERKQVEGSVRESEEKYRTVFENAGDAIAIHDLEGNFVEVNDIICSRLGYSREELLTMKVGDIDGPVHARNVEERIRELTRKGHIIFEGIHITRDGRQIPSEISAVLFHLGDKPLVMSISRDITERKQAEENLVAALNRTRDQQAALGTISFSPDLLSGDVHGLSASLTEMASGVLGVERASVWLFNDKGDELRCIDLYEVLNNRHSHDQVLNRNEYVNEFDALSAAKFIDAHDPLTDTRTAGYVEGYLRPNRITSMLDAVIRVSGKNRGVLCFEHVDRPHQWESDEIAFACQLADQIAITLLNHDRRQAEEQLWESEKRYHDVVEDQTEFICRFFPDGTHIFVNEAYCLYFDKKREEIIGHRFRPVIHPEDREIVGQHLISLTTGHPHGTIDQRIIMPDGSTRWQRWSDRAIFDQNGRVVEYQSVGRDITEYKELEKEKEYSTRELMQFSTSLDAANKKLTLLSGITRHDISNQLTLLRGYLQILEEQLPDPTLSVYFHKVTAAAERISAMIRFTWEYEAIGVNAPAWQDCHTILDIVAKEAPVAQVRVENNLPAGMEVYADPLIVKVFYNLMDNAVRYGGKITTIRFSVEMSGDDHLIVCEDDGHGIPADEKEKIFDRGFGKNTGLGLAISREILNITGITIRETGEPGKGARFEMVVPPGMYR